MKDGLKLTPEVLESNGLKVYDPDAPSPESPPEPPIVHRQPSIVDPFVTIISVTIALAATVAAIGVLALACQFARWATNW